jgi:creatinine amidohydrolase
MAAAPPIAVIPSGAFEVYGPHLPLASDSLVAAAIARLVAERLGAVCGPLVPVGNSRDLMSFPGTLTVEPVAFLRYMDGICRSLIRWGFKDLLFLNTHAGNVNLIDELAASLVEQAGTRCLQIDWWRFCLRVGRNELSDDPWAAGHAGELCTSVLMHLAGDLVRSGPYQDYVPEVDPWPGGIERYDAYRAVTSSGVLGRPTRAEPEKGKVIVELAVEEIVREARAHFGSPREGVS